MSMIDLRASIQNKIIHDYYAEDKDSFYLSSFLSCGDQVQVLASLRMLVRQDKLIESIEFFNEHGRLMWLCGCDELDYNHMPKVASPTIRKQFARFAIRWTVSPAWKKLMKLTPQEILSRDVSELNNYF